ncbi:MAG TPA: S8 family serine peptidase [Terriglobia bacterium]
MSTRFVSRALILLAALFLAAGPEVRELRGQQASGTPYKHPKLQTILASLAAAVPQEHGAWLPGRHAEMLRGLAMASMPKAVRDASRSGLMRIDAHGEVQVYVLVTAAGGAALDSALDSLRSAGATIELVDARNRIVQARAPVTRLEAVGALPVVRFVTLPNYGFPLTGSVESQGDSIIKATNVRATYHVDGSGVKVGAISDGLKGIFAACPAPNASCTVGGVTGGPISTGDLPEAMGTRNASGTLTSASGGITARSFSANQDLEGLPPPGCGFAGAGAEGTALLEILHDVAPGAQLYFANFDTSMAFEQAVDYIASNVDVGLDDIGFFGFPYDGTSPVSANTAAQLNGSGNPIRAWLTAVGNQAVNHYLGAYADSKVDGTSLLGRGGDLHLFQGNSTTTDILKLGPTTSDRVILPPNGEIEVVLTWNDPFGSSSNDYDLFLVEQSTGQVVASSTNPQTGTQDPVEFFDYAQPASAPEGTFEIVIQNAGNKAAVRNLNMFLFTPECAQATIKPISPPNHEEHNYNTPSSSVPAESDAGGTPASVVAVGAICSGVPQCPDYPNDPDHTQIEFYSSQGPTTDGRNKPDVTGIDGVSVTGTGDFLNPFFGTSAATPHAAGADALLLQLAPCLLSSSSGAVTDTMARQALHGLLLGNADPIGSPIPNNIYGSGRVDTLAAAEKEIPTLSAPATQTVNAGGGTLQATDQDPNGCPLTYNWTGTCGSGSGPTPSPNCPSGSNTVSLSATNNGVTLSPRVSIQVTATGFGIGASPSSSSVSPGQSASFTISVSPKFGAFTSAVTLACSGSTLPSLATCSFSPASVTPGSNAANAKLTISTTAASALFRPPGRRGMPLTPAVWLVCGAALLLGLGWRNRRPARAEFLAFTPGRRSRVTSVQVLALIVIAALAGYGACGGGGSSASPPPSNPGTPAGTYSVTVTGTFGQVSESATITLTVQ